MTDVPTVVCEACALERGASVPMREVSRGRGDLAVYTDYECQTCGATGIVEDRHGMSSVVYWGAATTERRIQARKWRVLEPNSGGDGFA